MNVLTSIRFLRVWFTSQWSGCELTNSAKIDSSKRQFSGDVVDLTGDEDPTDEDEDIGIGDPTGVSVSLGGEISSRGKESRESNIGDSDNTGDGSKTAGRAIITWGGGIASLISESEGTIVEIGDVEVVLGLFLVAASLEAKGNDVAILATMECVRPACKLIWEAR
ncbi:hypothetical protein Tco_0021067, partial [Tanacetum coccineum]